MPPQHQVEFRFAAQFARQLRWYPLESSNTVITNIAQVLYGSRGGYPYQWHEWFRNYGTNAGFTHSVAEKYVMVPPGVFHRSEEIYLVSAQPFFERGRLRRTIICKRANEFWPNELAEEWVQKAFAEAGREIPAPSMAAKPPAPPPGTTRIVRHHYLSVWLVTRGWFSQLEWWGMAPRTARTIEKFFWWGLSAVWIGMIGYCFWPVPAKVREAMASLSSPMSAARKIWTVIFSTVLFILALTFVFPRGLGSDRSCEQLFLHLLFPYHAAWEAMEYRGPSGSTVAALLLWAEILVYDFALAVAWIRNRLGCMALFLAVIHLLAIAFSILVLLSKR